MTRNHVNIVLMLRSTLRWHSDHKGIRGIDWQQPKREAEWFLRGRAVEFARGEKSLSHAAEMLGIPRDTLADWVRAFDSGRVIPCNLGRPVECASMERCEELIDAIGVMGPQTGLPKFHERFPDIARSEIEYLLRRERMRWNAAQDLEIYTTTWTRPGTVWAMDFTKPPLPIDGIYKSILHVRDLASGNVLIALPVLQETAEVVRDALMALFRIFGPPLCIRSDNGSQFKADIVMALFMKHRVLQLLTPAYTPEYNGEVEAGGGALKIHAHYESVRNGRPGEWTCDDVEAARLKCNELSRPRGHKGPSPNDLWNTREPISRELRKQIFKTVNRLKHEIKTEYRSEKKRINCAQIVRQSIRDALVAHLILKIRRRRFTQPIISNN